MAGGGEPRRGPAGRKFRKIPDPVLPDPIPDPIFQVLGRGSGDSTSPAKIDKWSNVGEEMSVCVHSAERWGRDLAEKSIFTIVERVEAECFFN